MRVVLQPKIRLCEGYRDMLPRGSEAFAFAHMRHSSKVFFALPLRLMHWFVGSSSLDISSICPGSSFGGGGNGVELFDHVLAYCGAGSIGIG